MPVTALADNYGLDAAQKATGDTVIKGSGDASTDVPQLVGKIINVGLGLIGIVFFLLVFYAGVLWMTASGGKEQIEKAKSIMIAAVVGLIIVMAAYAITNFVFTSLAVV